MAERDRSIGRRDVIVAARLGAGAGLLPADAVAQTAAAAAPAPAAQIRSSEYWARKGAVDHP
jgi:hypothetical protein